MSQLEQPEIHRVQAVPSAVVRGTVPAPDLPAFYDGAFGPIAQVLERQGSRPAGAAFGFYFRVPAETVELEVGFPTEEPITDDGEVLASELPAGQVARAVHVGGYDGLGESWGALVAWAEGQGRTPEGRMWESYLTEPTPGADPAAMRTELNLLLAD